ncbi:MAG TPA: class I SAM-dependent methyltransferase [Lapillicoccus sp.]|uniref:class I SAM-dependent methyltransferase n=1 Tax=Lapillicoccus sp. TaxID=1909287 RepID=UPI002F93A1E6
MTAADVRAYWDAEAAGFDEAADHGLRDPQVRGAWGRLLREHLPEPPADVLDLGCGTGTLTVLLAEGGHRVHGVDLAPAMVAAARAKIAASGTTATVEVGDASDPPGRAGAYDVVLTRHVLWALPDPSAALSRWVRLLRPGGRLLLVEGRWWTGGGLTAAETRRLLAPYAPRVQTVPLSDPLLWGGPVEDERYLCVATPSS